MNKKLTDKRVKNQPMYRKKKQKTDVMNKKTN